ncbi:hypothetical protein AK812_SmicGene17630 [Symbiodinium microadriaticum]|uniref:Uncharacterized protein n=1 Tax=Symbiodinium microadriaticum TaxID=2951 RepID=A0A1Q9DX77_SYMMI|nr:hypothetical protein AK812_SmicGene17630 [Symbiodinium microadriaticum]
MFSDCVCFHARSVSETRVTETTTYNGGAGAGVQFGGAGDLTASSTLFPVFVMVMLIIVAKDESDKAKAPTMVVPEMPNQQAEDLDQRHPAKLEVKVVPESDAEMPSKPAATVYLELVDHLLDVFSSHRWGQDSPEELEYQLADRKIRWQEASVESVRTMEWTEHAKLRGLGEQLLVDLGKIRKGGEEACVRRCKTLGELRGEPIVTDSLLQNMCSEAEELFLEEGRLKAVPADGFVETNAAMTAAVLPIILISTARSLIPRRSSEESVRSAPCHLATSARRVTIFQGGFAQEAWTPDVTKSCIRALGKHKSFLHATSMPVLAMIEAARSELRPLVSF